jgi:hypothetical protein
VTHLRSQARSRAEVASSRMARRGALYSRRAKASRCCSPRLSMSLQSLTDASPARQRSVHITCVQARRDHVVKAAPPTVAEERRAESTDDAGCRAAPAAAGAARLAHRWHRPHASIKFNFRRRCGLERVRHGTDQVIAYFSTV